MASLHLTKKTTVEELRREFNEAFGAQVRIYNGRSQAAMEEVLSCIEGNAITPYGELEFPASLTVASFIERMQNEYGLKVKVYTCDEWVAVLDYLTLEQAGKVKKNATKADMEKMVGMVAEIAADRPEVVKSEVVKILNLIVQEDIHGGENGFASDKDAIALLFDKTKEESRQDIFLRLTVIDSMYSTQMTRRYYGLDELSDALYTIKQNAKNDSLASLFLAYLQDRDVTPFCYFNEEDNRTTDLFSEKYGIGKDGNDKGIALSLISKYAYFDTQGKFPIYDSIACEMIPLIWKKCSFPNKTPSFSDNSGVSGKEKLDFFLDAIDRFKKNLGVEVSNDHLDRLLWFVGKIMRGNLSLVLCRKDFKWCCDNGYMKTTGNDTKFLIENVDIDELPFLQNQPLLYEFFKLAEVLKH